MAKPRTAGARRNRVMKGKKVKMKLRNHKLETPLEQHMREAHGTIMPRPELFLIPNETIYASDTEEALATYEQMQSLDIAYHPYSYIIIGVHGNIVFGMKVKDVNLEGGIYTLQLPKSDKDALRAYKDSAKVAQTASESFSRIWEITGDTMKSMPESIDWELRFYYYEGKHYQTLLRNSSLGIFKDMKHFIANKGKDPVIGEAVSEAMKIRMDAAGRALSRLLVVLLATRNAVKTRTKDKLLSLGIGKRKALNNQKPLYTTTITLPKLPSGKPGEPTGRTVAPHLRRGHIRQQAWGPRRSFHRAIFIEPIFVNADPTFVSSRVAYNTSLPPLTLKGDSHAHD